MFLTQLRAILRAAAHGKVNMLIPMLAHASEIRQTLSLVDFARAELDNRGVAHGPVEIGAMIEIPAAALIVGTFLKYFAFQSIGTNDLIQYTRAIDRAANSDANLSDPCHPRRAPAVGETIAGKSCAGQPVSVCGEMAGDITLTAPVLGLGLRVLHAPAQILAVKQEVCAPTRRGLRRGPRRCRRPKTRHSCWVTCALPPARSRAPRPANWLRPGSISPAAPAEKTTWAPRAGHHQGHRVRIAQRPVELGMA